MSSEKKKVEYLVVDTTAFIENAPLQNVAENMVTCVEVVDEIRNKRQLRRLVVLPYDLQVKDVFPESVRFVTDFAKKTGDYLSLSATDIKVMALTYQLEKEHVGVDHLRSEPLVQQTGDLTTRSYTPANLPGFYYPKEEVETNDANEEDETNDANEEDETNDANEEDETNDANEEDETNDANEEESDDDDDGNWITPSNVHLAEDQSDSNQSEEKHMKVACMTTDFAMQNVLRQVNLNVAALDGRMIKQLRKFIFRCYACYKTTSDMTKLFCPKCGLNTLKKVEVYVDEEGQMHMYINFRRPLTARGKKFSLPRMKGGKHPNNPILAPDHVMPKNFASKRARNKVNALDNDYIAGFSPFATRDVTSMSARLCIRADQEGKYFNRKNPNEARRRRK